MTFICFFFSFQWLIYVPFLYTWAYLKMYVGLFEHDIYVIHTWVLNKKRITSL